MEKAETPANVNLLENGDLQYWGHGWEMGYLASFVEGVGLFSTASSAHALRLGGDAYTNARAWQIVPINEAGGSYVFSGWAKANAVPDNLDDPENTDPAQDTWKEFGLIAILFPGQGLGGCGTSSCGRHLGAGQGRIYVVEKVRHEILEAPITVYNFRVVDFHTYYVADAGVLVHNTCKAARQAQLPTEGKIRYIPPEYASSKLPRTSTGGYIDRFDNVWTRGPSRTIGEAFEWDFQLSRRGKEIKLHICKPFLRSHKICRFISGSYAQIKKFLS